MYEPVVGLEVHAQISTATKMFCRCSNDFFGKEPNSTVCPVCMGFPGMLPVLNGEAVSRGIIAALALHCEIPEYCKFDRKNYFYPDLPKGFQISQYDQPISKNGFLEVMVDGKKRSIRINRLHLEDDAGKLTHVGDGTLCDYNRSGSPLMEIVSEPDIFSVEEAVQYAQELRKVLRTVGASECDMEKGMMRFDLNVSLRKKGETKLGVKAEIKNLNSFRNLEKALVYEIQRQTEILESGGHVAMETRGWNDEKGMTYSQRSKEEANDYRYFPEPDLPPLHTERATIEAFRKRLPELPLDKKFRYVEKFQLTESDAGALSEDTDVARYFEVCVEKCGEPKAAAAFITGVLLQHLHESGTSFSECKISPEAMAELITLIKDGSISNGMAKGEIFTEMFKSGKSAGTIVSEKGLKMVSDTATIDALCQKVIEANADVVESVKKGKGQAMGVLVGLVLKETKGQANPRVVNEILRKYLG